MVNSTINIYVANLKKYNEGKMVGSWFELPVSFAEIDQKCELNGGEEEWIILDYEAPFKISEYESINRLNELAEEISEVSSEKIRCLDELVDVGFFSDFYEALEEVDDVHVTEFNSWADYAEDFCEELGYTNGLPDLIKGHIDYAGIGRDLSIDDRVFQLDDGTIVEVMV